MSFGAREDVVGADVYKDDIPLSAEACESGGGFDVQGACPGGVAVAFVWEAVCCAVDYDLGSG